MALFKSHTTPTGTHPTPSPFLPALTRVRAQASCSRPRTPRRPSSRACRSLACPPCPPHAHASPRRQQVSPEYADDQARTWARLFLTYARHRRLFVLKVEDAEAAGGEWDEVLRNERIKRSSSLPDARATADCRPRADAAAVPERPTGVDGEGGPGGVRPPEADAVSHALLAAAGGVGGGPAQLGASCTLSGTACTDITQATSTGQLNTILTFYEITEPPIPSDLSDIPLPLLRSAIAILAKAGRAQTISIADGEGVRFFERRT
jgi:ESCRT-II complex subunit VPS25